jgi:hypothetical protein
MDINDALLQLQALGLTLPTPAYLFGAILFGLIGYGAWRYGKKKSRKYVKWLGVALMLYPYVVPSTWMMYVVGIMLCSACYYLRNRE